MIDAFLARWTFARSMTTDFVSEASEECLDSQPGPTFMTIRQQAAHLAEVQGIYQLALRGEEVDWTRKPEFGPVGTDVESILSALAARDAELNDLLDGFRDDPNAFRVKWYGNEIGLIELGSIFVQHESIHHGQWAAMATLGGFDRPVSWLINWGL